MNLIETSILREGHGGPIQVRLPSQGEDLRQDPDGRRPASRQRMNAEATTSHRAEPLAARAAGGAQVSARASRLRAWATAFVARLRMRHAARAEARAIRMTAYELDKFSDHSLRDIGFIRGSIESALREHSSSQGQAASRR